MQRTIFVPFHFASPGTIFSTECLAFKRDNSSHHLDRIVLAPQLRPSLLTHWRFTVAPQL